MQNWGVYRVPRKDWDQVERTAEMASTIWGIEVIIVDVPGDTVYVIDKAAMAEATRRMLFPEMVPFDPIAWKVPFVMSLDA